MEKSCCCNPDPSCNNSGVYKIKCLSETIIRKGYSPYISDETGTWFEYDDELKTYVDTHVPASGEITPITKEEVLKYWSALIGEEE